MNKILNEIPSAYNLKTSKTDDDDSCYLKFEYCHSKYPLEKLNNQELKAFIEFAKKIEKMTWRDIKLSDNGFNYETPRYFTDSIPDNIPKDATPVSLRVTKKFRIIGWR